MSLKVLHTENAPKALGPYSQAIQAGDFIYVSGQIGLNPVTGTVVEGGIEVETRQCLLNAQAILTSVDAHFDQVVKTTVLLADMNDFAAMNGVYSSFFTDHKPARAAFQVAKLPLGVTVEIEMVVYVGK